MMVYVNLSTYEMLRSSPNKVPSNVESSPSSTHFQLYHANQFGLCVYLPIDPYP